MNLFFNKFKNPFNHKAVAENAVCARMHTQLSAYVDNTLSAHGVWEVEKHLRTCPDCTQVLRQMQATVQLLHQVERQEAGNDFMAKLHARLDGLEPEPARKRSLSERLQDAGANLRAGLSSRRAPGFGLGIAAAGVVALAVFTHLPTPGTPTQQANTARPGSVQMMPNFGIHKNLQRNVALTANDPLGDVAAEYLESADTGKESNGS